MCLDITYMNNASKKWWMNMDILLGQIESVKIAFF